MPSILIEGDLRFQPKTLICESITWKSEDCAKTFFCWAEVFLFNLLVKASFSISRASPSGILMNWRTESLSVCKNAKVFLSAFWIFPLTSGWHLLTTLLFLSSVTLPEWELSFEKGDGAVNKCLCYLWNWLLYSGSQKKKKTWCVSCLNIYLLLPGNTVLREIPCSTTNVNLPKITGAIHQLTVLFPSVETIW